MNIKPGNRSKVSCGRQTVRPCTNDGNIALSHGHLRGINLRKSIASELKDRSGGNLMPHGGARCAAVTSCQLIAYAVSFKHRIGEPRLRTFGSLDNPTVPARHQFHLAPCSPPLVDRSRKCNPDFFLPSKLG